MEQKIASPEKVAQLTVENLRAMCIKEQGKWYCIAYGDTEDTRIVVACHAEKKQKHAIREVMKKAIDRVNNKGE